MKNKKVDIFILFLCIALSTFLVFRLSANLILSTALFFGLPALWLSIRMPQRILKSAIFAILFSIPFLFIIDHIAALDGAWHVPTQFPFRLLGTISLEDLFIGLGLAYFMAIFYEYFFSSQKRILGKKMKYFIGGAYCALLLFFIFFFFTPSLLYIPYAYMTLGIVLFIIPITLFLFRSPQSLFQFFKTIPYFFIFFMAYEVVGLRLGHWSFPGEHFIGWVSMFGITIPFEELLFWIILSPIAFFSYYEFFNND